MPQKIYQVDAFTDKVFSGNPAAVCPLTEWLSDVLLQNIAMENNLAETAFYVATDTGFHIRWFTPKAEVNLCGHATLATAFVLFNVLGYEQQMIRFQSRSGELTVTKKGDWFTLNFPTDTIEQIPITDVFLSCFDKKPEKIFRGKDDYLFIYGSQFDIETIQPDFAQIARFDKRGIIITAAGTTTDFVSRYFAPAFGINEDPVTGSAHTTLTPYWTQQLNKTELSALQLSERTGYLKCTYLNTRTEISDQAKLYLTGEIYIN